MASIGEARDAVDAAQQPATEAPTPSTEIMESHVNEVSADATEVAEDAKKEEAVDPADEETSSERSEHEHASDGDDGDEHEQRDDGGYEHNDDEYDPANPSHGDDGYEYDPADPQAQEGEYDPENPGDGFNNESEDPADTASTSEPTEKRKATSSVASSPSPSVSSVSRSPTRQRTGDARGPYKPDQRGLSDSVWDRLLDFELTGQFRVAQVSRASFASIAALPEFAQSAIVARFSRSPMKDIRDKNALIMRLYREYLAENPLVEKLQPVTAFVDDAASDPGLFAFGYAPPMPRTGVSTTKILFRIDKPGTFSTTNAFPKAKVVSEPQAIDEFGRVVKKVKTEGSQEPAVEAKPESTATTTPHVIEPSDTPTKAASSSAGKPSDPRRRRNEGSPAEPIRPTATPSSEPRVRHIEKSDVYNRLPPAVRLRLDTLISANRLPEAINDNVLSRLKHLPESTALLAVEKFAEADLGQVGNLNGFLVGIINRVQERGPQPSDSRGPSPSHSTAPPYRHPPSHTSHQPQQHQQYHRPQPHQLQPHQQQPSHHVPVQHQQYGGAPAHDRATTHLPLARPHHEHPGSHFRENLMQPPQTHAPAAAPPHAQVGYDRHYAPAHAPTYATEAPPAAPAAWQPMHAPTDPRLQYQQQGAGAPPTGGRFSSHPTIDRAVASLPVSVQNHLVSLVNSHNLPSLEDLSEKCYETLAQLSEGLAIDVLTRFGSANLSTVRNRSGFLMGVVKNCRQEYGFD